MNEIVQALLEYQEDRERVEISTLPSGCQVIRRTRLVLVGRKAQVCEEIELSCPAPIVDVSRARRARAAQ